VKNLRPGDLVTVNSEYSGTWPRKNFKPGDVGLIVSKINHDVYNLFLVLFPSGPEEVSGRFLEPVGSGK